MAEGQKRFKILIIEDDVFMLDLLSRELTAAGFEVLIAKNGKEGSAKFLSVKPDITLLDLILPDESGFNILRRIRREPDGVHAKVMILSNLSEAGDIEEAKRLGVLDYMVKANSSLPEIVQKIKEFLER